MELEAKQHQIAQLTREIRVRLWKLGIPMSSQVPSLCALSTSLRVGATINWRARLEAPRRSVLKMLINKCVAVSALPTTVQSPSYSVTTPSEELSYRDQRKPARTELMIQIVETVVKQAHSTTPCLAILVRHVFALGFAGLTLGNHD